MKYTALSCNLDPNSDSRKLAYLARAFLEAKNSQVTILDMRKLLLPPFDNDRIYSDTNFGITYNEILAADGVVIATTVYNGPLCSVAKQVIEATGEGRHKSPWFGKVVSFVSAGGLRHSYTAYTAMANTLMLDFKCIINPYSVYASEREWNEEDKLSGAVSERMIKAMNVKSELTTCLADRTYHSVWEI